MLCYHGGMANDHYVPQFYLREFCIPNKGGELYLYRQNKRPRRIGVSKVASDENYYSLKSDIPGVDRRVVDNVFTDIETASAPILKKLLTATKIELSEEEREQLCLLIGCLASRTPYAREGFQNLDSTFNLHMLKMFAGNKEAFFQQMRENSSTDTDEQLEEFRQHVLGGGMSVKYQPESNDYFLRTQLEAAQWVAQVIQVKEWHLLESDNSRVFVTSDNPVVIIRPPGHPPQLGCGFEQGYVALPLSSKRCLFMDHRKFANRVLTAKRNVVVAFNEDIIGNAYEAVYASVESKDIEKALNQTILGEKNKVTVLDAEEYR